MVGVFHGMRALVIALALALPIWTSGCGRAERAQTPAAPSPVDRPTVTIQSVIDGDTVRLTEPFLGATSVRLVNIDAAELGGSTQEPWARAARETLAALLPAGTGVRILAGPDPLDSFGRVLGIVVRSDGMDVNRELIRRGQVVTYFIWPNAERVFEYRSAQIEAQAAGRGIWTVGAALQELPFEYRQRTGGGQPFRPVGDVLTRFVVEAGDYRLVHVNNRLFFASRTAAAMAGYSPCPRANETYQPHCFAGGR